MGGNDNWQPDLMCEACDAPVVKGEDTLLTWQAVPYAICYVVTKNGEVAGFTTETSFDGYTTDDTWQVQAVNEYGGLSVYGTANNTTDIKHHTSDILHQTSAYNLAGQRVDANYKGVVIVNGQKKIQK